jgi:hypothetical protein
MTSVQTLERPRKRSKSATKDAPKRQELPPVMPHIVCDGAAKAIDFYKKAACGQAHARGHPDRQGVHHAGG